MAGDVGIVTPERMEAWLHDTLGKVPVGDLLDAMKVGYATAPAQAVFAVGRLTLLAAIEAGWTPPEARKL